MGRKDTPGGAPEGAIKLHGAGRRSAPPYWGKEKRTEGWPGTRCTGQRSVGSAGYLTIESEQNARAAARIWYVIYAREGHLWNEGHLWTRSKHFGSSWPGLARPSRLMGGHATMIGITGT